jgi:hypothetical protein
MEESTPLDHLVELVSKTSLRETLPSTAEIGLESSKNIKRQKKQLPRNDFIASP